MKYSIYTLGCKVNTYESNVMSDLLTNAGYIEGEPADIAIINTCTVTNTADSKSVKVIKQAIRKNPDAIIVVVGCLSQVSSLKVASIPGVHIVLGNKNKSKILEYINTYQKTREQIIDIYDLNHEQFECMKLNNFNKTRAFVKIEDGCENFCAYCIIPYTRGNVRSRKKEDILEEIEMLVELGHREVVLTGIHTGHYGSDLKDVTFASLLQEIVQIPGLERLRISSIEITEIDSDVLHVIQNSTIIVDHMHIPLQSGCDKTLKEMNRKYDVSYFKEKIRQIRSIRPDMSITTDVIVGFPNETEEDFLITMHTIREIQFSKIHVFPYSARRGTVAASMPNQIDEVEKKKRVKQLLELSKELEIMYMQRFLGDTLTFIPEVYKDGFYIGHTGNYLLVRVRGEEGLLHELIPICISHIAYPYCEAVLDSVLI